MKTLVTLAAKHPVFANLLMAVMLVGGCWGFTHMRAEVFPDVSTEQVQILYPYPAASAEEVESGVILRVEEALEGLEGVDDVLSVSREGLAQVYVELKEADADEHRVVVANIKDRIDGITGLPDSVEEPTVRELLIELPAALVVIHGPAEEHALRGLTQKLKDRLRAEGIGQIHVTGIRDYEISIELSEEKLRAHGLSLQEVARIVEQSSLNLPAGSLRTLHEELKLEVRGRRVTGRAYRDLVVQTQQNGTTVTLGQLARIVDGFDEQGILGRFKGQRACLIQINAAEGDDTIEIAARAIKTAEEIERDLPEGVEVEVLGDFSRDIVDRIGLLLRNGWQGLLLLFGCLVLMLNLRLSLWVAAGIPVAFACAGLMAWGAGQSLNMINLFGLILVLGIVVDDAIVVGENVYARQEAGDAPLEAAIAGASQVSWPVLAGVTTTIVAFMPLFFVDGVMGKFISQMPLIVIATLIGSLIESLFILPNHLAHSQLRPAASEGADERVSLGARIRARLDAGFRWVVANGYVPAFQLSLRHRFTTVALAFTGFLACAGLIAGDVVAFVMLPKEDSVYTQVDVTFPAGTPFEVTKAALIQLEAAAARVNAKLASEGESEGRGPFVGIYAEAGNGGQEHVGKVVAALRPSENRSLHSEKIMSLWREAAGSIVGATRIRFGQFGGVWSKDIELKIRGDDVARVRAAAEAVREAVARQPGTLDASTDYLPGKRELRVSLRPLGRLQGITVGSLAGQVRAAFYGDEALSFQRGRDEVEVQVRYPMSERASRSDLRRMWVRNPAGATFPFAEVAVADLVPGLAEIRRRNGQREITVTAKVDEDSTTASRVSEALALADLPQVQARFPGLAIEVKGAAEESAETLASLVQGFGAAGLGMFAILALVFRSYLQPLLIMAAIPFGFVGAILAHFVAGMPFTMLSVFGLVALAGVVVNDTLVLIDRINELQRKGVGVIDALHQAGPSRFRAILLTTITTVAGLFPLLFERSFQAQFVIPMGISLAGGLIIATFGTLFVVPSLYLLLNDFRRAVRWARTGVWPTREAVEPSFQEAGEPEPQPISSELVSAS